MKRGGNAKVGANGYIWFFGTPLLRYFHRAASRGGAVVAEVLGGAFEGALISDFYAAYNTYSGPHQRCWADLLRDVRDLRVAHPDDVGVATWPDALHALYQEATRQAALARPEAAPRATPWSANWPRCVGRFGRSTAPRPRQPAAAASTRSSTSC